MINHERAKRIKNMKQNTGMAEDQQQLLADPFELQIKQFELHKWSRLSKLLKNLILINFFKFLSIFFLKECYC